MNRRLLVSLTAAFTVASTLGLTAVVAAPALAAADADATQPIVATTPDVVAQAEQIEKDRRALIEKVTKAYCFIGGGSGVVISPDGYIITNDHVAGERRDWRVRMTNGVSYKAHVTGTDPVSDFTLLKFDDPPKDLHWLNLGDSDKLEVGQTVMAVGNPFGLGDLDDVPTVTFGVVSSLHRYQANYSDAIMTDVALNPGNSGGPLVTLAGDVVGINGRIASRFGVRANSGIGYAIPSNQIAASLEALKKAGGFYVFRSQIQGLETLRIASETEREFVVHRVDADSDAEKAGFQPNDVITQIAGHPLEVANRYYGILANLPPGQTITVQVRRIDDTGVAVKKDLSVHLSDLPIENMNPDIPIRKTLGLTLPPPAGDGSPEAARLAAITIKAIKKGQSADLSGLKVGDVLKKINGVELHSQEDWIRAYTKLQIGEKYPITVQRDGKDLDLTLIPDLKRTPDLYE
ncbi:MAG: trypsin-like peptidase domain-containing protein [Planctomycetota bacterium]